MQTRKMIHSKKMGILYLVIGCLLIGGCAAKSPLYVIDVQKLAGVEPTAADQLIQEMVPCQLKWEHRWEQEHWLKGEVDVLHIGKLCDRMYEIENGQIDRWQYKPQIHLSFNADYEERVNGLMVDFIEYVDTINALRRLGYDPNKRIKHINLTNGWYFITTEYLHQVHLMDTGESTAVTIHLDSLTH